MGRCSAAVDMARDRQRHGGACTSSGFVAIAVSWVLVVLFSCSSPTTRTPADDAGSPTDGAGGLGGSSSTGGAGGKGSGGSLSDAGANGGGGGDGADGAPQGFSCFGVKPLGPAITDFSDNDPTGR